MPINCQFGQRATGLCSICGKWDIDVDRTEEGTWGRKGDGTSWPFAIGVGLVFSDVRAAPCVPFDAFELVRKLYPFLCLRENVCEGKSPEKFGFRLTDAAWDH